MNLIEDYNDGSGFEILESDLVGGERTHKLVGSLGKCNFVNKNKRIYPMSVMRPVVEGLQESIKENRFGGELGHPANRPSLELERMSHRISSFRLDENTGDMIGEIIPLSTPHGQILNGLLKDRIRVGVSTRATGSVKPYNGPLAEGISGIVEVQPGLKIFCVDIVSDPSAGTYPDLVVENTQQIITGIPFKRVWALSFKNIK